jgi:hypothetical protein
MPSRSFASRRVREIVVFVLSRQAPTDAEWDEMLVIYRQLARPTLPCALVYTAGGAPNAKQRASLRDVGSARIAVLTASAVARAAGVAVSWFNPEIRIYGPHDVEKALNHLDVPEAERRELRQALAELQRALGLAQIHASP